VAINRHEFLPKSDVASATHQFEIRRIALVSPSPSLLAPVRGTTAGSAVLPDQRSSVVAAGRAAASFPDGVFASQIAATTPARCCWSTPVTTVTVGTPDYVRLFEAT
jgi:hypothetical protein